MNGTQVVEMNENDFEEAALRSEVPVLVDFTAVWCPPCRTIAPHVESVAARYAGRLKVAKVDADANPELASRYGVRGLPTLLLFKGGEVVGQLVGAVARARIEALVERAL